MTTELRDGTTTEDPRLGRVPSTNERRLQRFSLATKLPELGIDLDRPLRSFSWAYVQLNQGDEPACTGFDETMEAAARPKPFFGDPVRQPPNVAELNSWGHRCYQRAKELDEYPGTDYAGSSLDGAAKAGVELGYADSYYWATGTPEEMVQQAMLAVAYKGPVKCGSWWRAGMDRQSPDGFISYAGAYRGGHAYLWTRYSLSRDALWTPNSWDGFGQGWMRRADLVRLAAEHGEFCFTVGRRLRAS